MTTENLPWQSTIQYHNSSVSLPLVQEVGYTYIHLGSVSTLLKLHYASGWPRSQAQPPTFLMLHAKRWEVGPGNDANLRANIIIIIIMATMPEG